jgi:hypothetical protein
MEFGVPWRAVISDQIVLIASSGPLIWQVKCREWETGSSWVQIARGLPLAIANCELSAEILGVTDIGNVSVSSRPLVERYVDSHLIVD